MKQLANTLFVTTPDAYLALDGENVVILKKDTELRRVPLHNLEGIIAFGYTGASPALMGACAKRKIALSFLTQNGKFLARTVGEEQGNVLLRKTQYRLSSKPPPFWRIPSGVWNPLPRWRKCGALKARLPRSIFPYSMT